MKRIIKCGTAFLLALVLCLCLLPTTAFAASKQVYIWNFPLSDDTLKSSGNWGHGVLNLRFGYRVGASSYTQFRCLDSWQGEVAYCIEPGAPQKNYDSITDHDDTWWDHLSLPDGHPLTPREVQRQIGRIMSYGYHGTIGGGWWADVESTAEKMAWAYATQVLIWEVVAGERDSSSAKTRPNCRSSFRNRPSANFCRSGARGPWGLRYFRPGSSCPAKPASTIRPGTIYAGHQI